MAPTHPASGAAETDLSGRVAQLETELADLRRIVSRLANALGAADILECGTGRTPSRE